jgi:cell wall-associated NlpC family hydrolase
MEAPASVSRDDVVAAARRWLDTPFHHQGRAKSVGVDCAGVLVEVARELGLGDVDIRGYGHRPDSRELERLCYFHMTLVRLLDAEPGDVLLIEVDGQPQHIAFLTRLEGEAAMLHAYAPARRVVEHRMDEEWGSRVVAAFRLPGIA